MPEPVIDFDDPAYIEQARRKLYPAYRVAAECVDEWKAREERALEKRQAAKGWLSWTFWQVQYLSAVGNGAEAERCRDGLFDPYWGCISQSQDKKACREAYEIAIGAHNQRVHGL